MVPALLVMCGLGAVLGIVLSVASKIFYVYEDPRIALVEDCLAGANCGGCGFAGCSAAAVAVVEGKAPANVCIVGGRRIHPRGRGHHGHGRKSCGSIHLRKPLHGRRSCKRSVSLRGHPFMPRPDDAG